MRQAPLRWSNLKAIDATFKNRETVVPTDDFEVLTPDFAERHLARWNAFVKKMGEGIPTNEFGEVIEDLKKFADLKRPSASVCFREA